MVDEVDASPFSSDEESGGGGGGGGGGKTGGGKGGSGGGSGYVESDKEEEEVTAEMIDAKLGEIREMILKGHFPPEKLPWITNQMEAALEISMAGKEEEELTDADADADNYALFYKGQKCFIEVVYLGEDESQNSWLEADGTDTIKDMKSRIAKEKGIDNSNAIKFIFRKKGDGKSMKFADDTTFETVMMEYWGKDQSCRIQMKVDLKAGGKRAKAEDGDEERVRLSTDAKIEQTKTAINIEFYKLTAEHYDEPEAFVATLQQKLETTDGNTLKAILPSLTVAELGKLQALGGQTGLYQAKLNTVASIIYAHEVNMAMKMGRRATTLQQVFRGLTDLALVVGFAQSNGRVSWEELAKQAGEIRDAKVAAGGAIKTNHRDYICIDS